MTERGWIYNVHVPADKSDAFIRALRSVDPALIEDGNLRVLSNPDRTGEMD